jgi:predicted DNA-binding transcriptional regulator AlpA
LSDSYIQSGNRIGKTRFPSIDTLNRHAAEKTDVRKKIRYFRKLLLQLDGEIGDCVQTFRELMKAGELVDPEGPQLEIERLQHLRDHAARHLELISEEPFGEPATSADDEATASVPLLGDPPASPSSQSDDDLLDVKELAALFGKSKSWVYHESSKKAIPRLKIGGELRFRRGDIKEWVLDQQEETINPEGIR